MIYKRLDNNSIFIFSEEMELMFAGLSILQIETVHKLCTKIYGEEGIALLKRKYKFLIEVYNSFKSQFTCSIFEHLLYYPLEGFCLNEYKNYLLNLDMSRFINIYLSMNNEEEILEAMKSEENLENFYYKHNDIWENYLGFYAFFKETKRYIMEFFEFVEELRTDDFNKKMKDIQAMVLKEVKRFESNLVTTDALEYSQTIMGKTFYNRGPYKTFVFSPSLMVPYKGIRFFAEDQILFYSIRPTQLEDEVMLKQLKTIADSTRLRIISLLNEKEPLRGMDIAKELSLASSTVSHHMDQLKEAGLVHEEQVRNSKYYSINTNSVDELLKLLTEALGHKNE